MDPVSNASSYAGMTHAAWDHAPFISGVTGVERVWSESPYVRAGVFWRNQTHVRVVLTVSDPSPAVDVDGPVEGFMSDLLGEAGQKTAQDLLAHYRNAPAGKFFATAFDIEGQADWGTALSEATNRSWSVSMDIKHAYALLPATDRHSQLRLTADRSGSVSVMDTMVGKAGVLEDVRTYYASKGLTPPTFAQLEWRTTRAAEGFPRFDCTEIRAQYAPSSETGGPGDR